MKKFSLLIIALSLLLYSCDSSSSDTPASDEQMSQAAAALKVVTDGMNILDSSVINEAKALSESGTIDKAAPGETQISNKDGMVITMKPVIDAKLNAGLQLRFTLTDYESKTTIINADGTQTEDITYVTGEFTAVMAYNVLTQKIVIIVNTTAGKELVFKGGSMNGLKMGFTNLEMSFNTSSVTLGSPVAVKGTVTINSVPVVIDSEIIELIMGLMGI